MELALALIVNFFIEDNFLIVNYRVVNNTYNTLYLITTNTRHDIKLGPVPDSSVVQLSLHKDTLEIIKAKPVAPQDRFYTPSPYFVSTLKTKEEYSESFRLKLPVEIPVENKKSISIFNKKNALYVKFSIQYIVGNKFINEKIVMVNGEPYKILVANTSEIEANQIVKPPSEGVLTSTTKSISVPLKIIY